MKIRNKISALALVALMAVSAFVPALTTDAASNVETRISYIGGSDAVYGATNLKINNKSASKMKKSVRVATVAKNKRGFEKISAAFTEGNAKTSYVTTYDYQLDFLKAGTYNVAYQEDYEKYYYDDSYYGDDNEGNSLHTITRTDLLTDKTTTLSGYFTRRSDSNYNSYYENSQGEIYAYSYDINKMVKAKLVNGELQYQAPEYGKRTVKLKIKVNKTIIPTIKSISLGNGKYDYSETSGDGYYSYTSTNKRLLSGNKGKLKVAVGKNTKITDIVIKTYDKNGNTQYKMVKNNKSVNFGKYAYKYESSYKNSSTGYSYSSKSRDMFKTTTVYVFYKDKISGSYTDIKSIKKNKDGSYTWTYTQKNGSAKAVTSTSSYVPGSYFDSYTFYK